MSVQRASIDTLVREKTDTADPVAWSYIDNSGFVILVGGVATVGPYVVTVVPEDKTYPPIPITFDRVAEANPAIGDGIVTETDTLLAVTADGAHPNTVLSAYLQSPTNNAGAVTFIPQPNAPDFKVLRSAPAPGTLDIDMESTVAGVSETFPLTVVMTGRDPELGFRTDIDVWVTAVDVDRVPLDPGIGVTYDLRVRRMIDRGEGTPVGVSDDGWIVDVPLNGRTRVEGGGGRFSFATSVLSATPVGTDHLEIWVREVTG